MNRRHFLLNSGLLAAGRFATAQQQGAAPQTTLGRAGRGRGRRQSRFPRFAASQRRQDRQHAGHEDHRHQDLPGRRRRPQLGLRQDPDGPGHFWNRRSLLRRSRRSDRQGHRRFQDLADRERSAQRAISFRRDVQHDALSRRHRRELRDQRHRARPLGHRRQIRGRAGVGAARRPRAKQDPRLSEHRRRPRRSRRAKTPSRWSRSTATRR